MGNKNTNKPVVETEQPVGKTESKIVNEESIKTAPLTPEEQAIFARVQKPQSDWENIKEEEMVDFSLSADMYEKPIEAQELEKNKKFAFRFIEMTPKRIDQVTNWPYPAKWNICNRASHPELAKYCDPVHGAIQKEEQIMVYKPWHFHVRHQQSKEQAAAIKDESRSLDSKNGRRDLRADGSVRAEYKSGEEHKIGNSDVVMQEI